MLTALVLGLAMGTADEVKKDPPPAKLELFAKEGWYRDQKGKEEDFVGVLHFTDRPKNTVGFGRFNPYTLAIGEGKTAKVREVYVGVKPELLRPYIGKRIKLIGKAVDMEVEGKQHHEIWPARLEVVPVEKKDTREPTAEALDSFAIAVTVAADDRRREEEEQKARVGKELKILAQASWRPAGKDAKQLVIRSPEELAKVSGGNDKAAEVLAKQFKIDKIDWKTQMVVVVSDGVKRTGGYSIDILGLNVRDKELTVRWKLNSPEPGTPVTFALTHPAKAVLVERVEADKVRFDPPPSK